MNKFFTGPINIANLAAQYSVIGLSTIFGVTNISFILDTITINPAYTGTITLGLYNPDIAHATFVASSYVNKSIFPYSNSITFDTFSNIRLACSTYHDTTNVLTTINPIETYPVTNGVIQFIDLTLKNLLVSCSGSPTFIPILALFANTVNVSFTANFFGRVF